MDKKDMDKLVKTVEDLIEYNQHIREQEQKDYKLKSRKKYKNVPTEPWEVIFVQEM